METKQINKFKASVLNYVKELNEYETIKIKNSEEKRIIFKKNCFKMFNLNPFNEYSYIWLTSFLDSVIYVLDYEGFKDFDELNEVLERFEENLNQEIDNETDIYTYNLTKWLNSDIENIYYLSEVLKYYDEKDCFKLLQMAQYKAISEFYYKSNESLKDLLETEFN